MHRIALLFGLICFILAAAGSYFGAIQAVDRFEKATEKKLEQKNVSLWKRLGKH